MSLINCIVVQTHVCCVRATDTASTTTNKDRLAHLQHLIVCFLQLVARLPHLGKIASIRSRASPIDSRSGVTAEFPAIGGAFEKKFMWIPESDERCFPIDVENK